MSPALIRITEIDCKEIEGEILKIKYESQDGPDWFPRSTTLVGLSWPSEVKGHIKCMKKVADRAFGVDFGSPNVVQLKMSYYKPTKKVENPSPNALQYVYVATEVDLASGIKSTFKLPSLQQYYAPNESGLSGYLSANECIAIEHICDLISRAIADESNKGGVFKPVQLSLAGMLPASSEVSLAETPKTSASTFSG